MVGVKMCAMCRRLRQKCKPEKRIWEDGGVREKCERCFQYGHRCGPPEAPSARVRSICDGNQIKKVKEVKRVPSQDYLRGCTTKILNEHEPISRWSEDQLELRRRLTAVDMRVDTSKKFQFAIDFLESSLREEEVHYTQLLEVKYANARELLLMLSPAEALADRVEAAGDLEAAENAYTRILNAYRTLHTKHWHEIRGLLLKLANMFWRISEPLRAEALLWEALELPSSPARNSDLELLKTLARSLRKTSDDLSSVSQSTVIQPIPSIFSSPFPPLHRMMESKYAFEVQGNIFQTGGLNAVLELLREFSDSELEMRDVHGRTPLYLASTLQMEALGHGLLIRGSEIDGMACRMANARDLSGQTVLGISITSRCSLEFVSVLIENGAEVDPPLMQLPFTPLQVACSLGAYDIAALLLKRNAAPNRVYPGSKTAEMLAQEAGHSEIVELLGNPLFTKSNSAFLWQDADILNAVFYSTQNSCPFAQHDCEWYLECHLDHHSSLPPKKIQSLCIPGSSITTPLEIL